MLFKKKWGHREYEEADLNLTPFMDMMVTLIPFLLLSVSFIRLGGINVEVPNASTTPPAKMQKKDEKIELTFEVKNDQVTVLGFTEEFTKPVKAINMTFPVKDTLALKNYIFGLQSQYPQFGNTMFHATSETKYEDAVGVLNVMRGVPFIKDIVLAAGIVE